MSINADRNLLLGVLAFQNAFVTRDALLAGMQAWLFDKSKSLADILHAQGALDAVSRQLLEAIAERHLQQYGGDPAKSLDALHAAKRVHRELEQVPDDDLQASLGHFRYRTSAAPGHADGNGEEYATCYFVGAATSAGTRFQRLRPHAKGGLGEVFVALDAELNREVALKEILDRRAGDAAARARFLLEAQITGGLEHPGIVPVYGLGTHPDGRPFYAMRLIRGDCMTDAIRKLHSPTPRSESSGPAGAVNNLQLYNLLRRFIDVCNTLQYAHDRGVLHRDVKPNNIMLGKYGETLVVDWGLAKATGAPGASATGVPGEAGMSRADASTHEPPLQPSTGSSGSETLPGTALGTPAFMSPEQAAGRVDLITAASDVYSLGATLYSVITGEQPFRGEVAEILQKVKAGDFPRPRMVKPDASPALEAICLKAMALRPADRYATPRDLADDVERWLADEPVRAWPEPWSVRLGRWTRRHRTLTATAATALLLVGIGALGLSWLAHQHHAAEEAQTAQVVNQAMGQANALRDQALAMAPGDADEQAREAALWRDALAAGERVEKALDSGPANAETRRAAQAMLLDLRGQADDAAKDRKMLRSLEEALERSVELQDSDYVHAKGRMIVWGYASAQAYARAFKDYGIDLDTLSAEEAAEWMHKRRIRLQLASALDHWYFVEPTAAKGKLLDIANLAAGDPLSSRVRAAIARKDAAAMKELAAHEKVIDLPPSTLILLVEQMHQAGMSIEGLDLMQRARRKHPGDFWIQDHTGIYLALGPRSGWSEATRAYAAAIALRPRSYVAWSNLGMTLMDLGQYDDAVTALRRSLELNPNFTTAINWLSAALIQKGEPKQGLAVIQQARSRFPDSPMLLTAEGNALRRLGRTDEAFTAYQQALAKEPNWHFAQEQLAEIHSERGEKAEALKLIDRALQMQPTYLGLYIMRWRVHYAHGDYDAAVKAGEAAVACKPQSDVAHYFLATALYKKQKYAGAAAEYRIASRLAPSNAFALYNLGNALVEHKQFDDALLAFEAAVHWNADRALFHNGVGEGLMHQKRYAEATLAFKRAVALAPDSADNHSNLSWAYFRAGYHADAEREAATAIQLDSKNAVALNAMGNAIFGQGRYADAVPYYEKAMAITPKDGVIQMNLGRSLYRNGDFTQGHKWLMSSVQVLSATSPNRETADKELKECDRALALDKQLQAFRDKGELPKGGKDVLELADIARRYKQHHLTAVALYSRIFKSDADLTDELIGDHRYRAAGCALLAAAGKAADLSKPRPDKQSELRAQARRWLRAELERATQRTEAGKSEDTPHLVDRISRWKTDKELESIRDPQVMQDWPDDEQKAWHDLWEDANLFVRVLRAGMMQVVLQGTLTPTARSQTHDLKLVKGQTYVVDLECSAFEPSVRLDDPAGKRVAEHEDVGPSPRTARIVITAPADGVYRLVAGSVAEAGLGPYSLRVAALKDLK